MRLSSAFLVLALGCQAQQPSAPVANDAAFTVPVAAPQPVAAPEPVDAAPRTHLVGRHVLVVGDSEACAVGSYINLKKTVAAINAEAGQPTDSVEVDCKGGTVVPYWGSGGNFRAALGRHPTADTVLVFLGTNHYWNQKDTPNVAPILDLVRERKLSCVWVGNTAVHGHHWNVNNLLREAVTPTCSYFDTEAADIPLADGVHPSPAGATKWIRLIWPTIPLRHEEDHERTEPSNQ